MSSAKPSASQARATAKLVSVVGLLVGLGSAVTWVTLPDSLSNGAAERVVTDAEYKGARRPYAQFVLENGIVESVSCGQIAPLCAHLKAAPAKRLTVWWIPSKIGLQPRVVAVEAEGQMLLSETMQQATHDTYQPLPAFVAGFFLFFAALAMLSARRNR